MHSETQHLLERSGWPALKSDTPIIYEDEELGDMGEVNRHANTNLINFVCVRSFLHDRHPHMNIFFNMNCYYAPGPKHKKTGSLPYFSSDNMIVEPYEPLSEDVRSYWIGQSGPAPLAAIETLSEGTIKQTDLGSKLRIYADLKIPEYILIDVTGEYLPEKLLLKRLQKGGTWKDERDSDGGVTSNLGFRLQIDENGELVVIDSLTDRRYARPQDAVEMVPVLEAAARAADKARKQAERKVRDAQKKAEEAEARVRESDAKALALQAELERLRSKRNGS